MREERAHRIAPLLLAAGLLPALLLAGCNRSEPPADQLEEALSAKVDEVEQKPQNAGPYAPRDECKSATGASAFMAKVKAAVAARDTAAFVDLAAEDVKLDFGGGAGQAELRSLLADAQAPLWAKLDEMMTLGCASDGDALITLPWYFAQEISTDPYKAMIVTGEGVPVREAPAEAAPVVAAVSWDVVEMLENSSEPGGFAHVRWKLSEPIAGKPDVMEGYIEAARLRSLIDYRLLAASRNGKWRITSLIAGD